MTAILPTEFADLEAFAEWCLPSEAERYAKRLGTSMPDDVLNLMHLLYSMIMVSFPVECWKQPRVPDSGAASLDCLSEPVP